MARCVHVSCRRLFRERWNSFLSLSGECVSAALRHELCRDVRDQRRAFYRPSSAVCDFLLSRIHSEVERKIDQMIPMKSTIYENSEPPRYFLAIPLAVFTPTAGPTLLSPQPQKSPANTSKGTEAAKIEPKAEKEGNDATGVNDFDFLIGKWPAHPRPLNESIAGNHGWIEFEGTCGMQKILGGAGNMDENVLDFPGSAYRAVTLRTYDPAKGQWSIVCIDSRNPSQIHSPV